MNQDDLRPKSNGFMQVWNEPIRMATIEWVNRQIGKSKTPRVRVYWNGSGDPYVEAVGFELPQEPMALEVLRKEKRIRKPVLDREGNHKTKRVKVKKKHPITGEVISEDWKDKKLYTYQTVGGLSTVYLVVKPEKGKMVMQYDDQIRLLAKRFIGWLRKKDACNFELRLREVVTVYDAIDRTFNTPEEPEPEPVVEEPKDMHAWRVEGVPEDKRHSSLETAIKKGKKAHALQRIRTKGRKERGRRPSKETAKRAHHSRGRKLELYLEAIEQQGANITEQELMMLVDNDTFGRWKEAQREGWVVTNRVVVVDTPDGKKIAIPGPSGIELVEFTPDPRDEQPSGRRKKKDVRKPIVGMDDCPV